MRINPAATDLVSSRLREICPSETSQERSYHHHRPTQLGTFADKICTGYIIRIDIIRLECIYTLLVTGDLDSHTLKKENQITYIQDFRNIGNLYGFSCQEHRADHLQGLILCALRPYRATKFVAAFYYE